MSQKCDIFHTFPEVRHLMLAKLNLKQSWLSQRIHKEVGTKQTLSSSTNFFRDPFFRRSTLIAQAEDFLKNYQKNETKTEQGQLEKEKRKQFLLTSFNKFSFGSKNEKASQKKPSQLKTESSPDNHEFLSSKINEKQADTKMKVNIFLMQVKERREFFSQKAKKKTQEQHDEEKTKSESPLLRINRDLETRSHLDKLGRLMRDMSVTMHLEKQSEGLEKRSDAFEMGKEKDLAMIRRKNQEEKPTRPKSSKNSFHFHFPKPSATSNKEEKSLSSSASLLRFSLGRKASVTSHKKVLFTSPKNIRSQCTSPSNSQCVKTIRMSSSFHKTRKTYKKLSFSMIHQGWLIEENSPLN